MRKHSGRVQGLTLFSRPCGQKKSKSNEQQVTPTVESTAKPQLAEAPSRIEPPPRMEHPAFKLGDRIEVYSGNDRIGEGRYIESTDHLLVWVNATGYVTFTFLGKRISIIKR